MLLPVARGAGRGSGGDARACPRADRRSWSACGSRIPGTSSDMQERPWAEITPHLLRNRTSFANSYALLSEGGAALLIDFGYDVSTGLGPITERSARRPAPLGARGARSGDHGVERIEAVDPDPLPRRPRRRLILLREVEGAEVWAPANVAPMLVDPRRYDLPCLWYEPIPVDRVLPLERAVRVARVRADAARAARAHALRGGDRVRGRREARARDRRPADDRRSDGGRPILNYQYRNRSASATTCAAPSSTGALRPDLLDQRPLAAAGGDRRAISTGSLAGRAPARRAPPRAAAGGGRLRRRRASAPGSSRTARARPRGTRSSSM